MKFVLSSQAWLATLGQHVVQLPDNRYEVRNELDGTQDVAHYTPGGQFCVPRYLRVPKGSQHDPKLLKKSSDWGLGRFDRSLLSISLMSLYTNVHLPYHSAEDACPVRPMHRKPMWLIPVSIICGWRAAGR